MPKIEVLSRRERRRRWSTEEKLAIVQETYEPDVTISIVARRHGIQPSQLFAWRKLAARGALTASQEDVVPTSEHRAMIPKGEQDCKSKPRQKRLATKKSQKLTFVHEVTVRRLCLACVIYLTL